MTAPKPDAAHAGDEPPAPSASPPSTGGQIARAAGTVMLAFLLSNVVGLVRQVLVSQTFGTSAAMDAFNAAARLPDLLFSLVAGGALGSAFIPVLTELLVQERRAAAWRLASALANLVVAVLAGVSLVAAWAARPIVAHLLAPGFSPEQQALTVDLLRILLLTPAIFGLSGLSMGVLHSHRRFLWPALAPTMYWLGMIFGVLVLAPRWGIYGLAWGAVLGALAHWGVQAPGLARLPARRYVFTWGWDMPEVRRVFRLMVPRWLGVAVVQLNFWINVVLASSMPEGSLTAIQVAWAVMTMPQVVIAQAIAIAALPTFAAQAARGHTAALRASLVATLRGVLFLALPATVGLVVLRRPVVAVLFQRGAFDEHSTRLVAWALLWYTLGLVAHSLVEILSRAFYALQDTRTPVVVGAGAMTLNLALSFALAAAFRAWGWMPHGGLALANTIATSLEALLLMVLIRRALAGLPWRAVGDGLLRAGLAAGVMGVAVAAYWARVGHGWPRLPATTAAIALGTVVYAGAVAGIAPQERAWVWAQVQRGWHRLRRPRR